VLFCLLSESSWGASGNERRLVQCTKLLDVTSSDSPPGEAGGGGLISGRTPSPWNHAVDNRARLRRAAVCTSSSAVHHLLDVTSSDERRNSRRGRRRRCDHRTYTVALESRRRQPRPPPTRHTTRRRHRRAAAVSVVVSSHGYLLPSTVGRSVTRTVTLRMPTSPSPHERERGCSVCSPTSHPVNSCPWAHEHSATKPHEGVSPQGHWHQDMWCRCYVCTGLDARMADGDGKWLLGKLLSMHERSVGVHLPWGSVYRGCLSVGISVPWVPRSMWVSLYCGWVTLYCGSVSLYRGVKIPPPSYAIINPRSGQTGSASAAERSRIRPIGVVATSKPPTLQPAVRFRDRINFATPLHAIPIPCPSAIHHHHNMSTRHLRRGPPILWAVVSSLLGIRSCLLSLHTTPHPSAHGIPQHDMSVS
jgi:hypothetical protein